MQYSASTLGNGYNAARATLLDRLALLAAGGAGELTPARAAALDRLIVDLTAGRSALLDQLAAAGFFRSGTLQVPKFWPDLAGPTLVQSGVANALGAWTQLVAAATIPAGLCVGFAIDEASSGFSGANRAEIQFGMGGVGAEVEFARYYASGLTSAGLWMPAYHFPGVTFTANARLSARVRALLGTSNFYPFMMFFPGPL